MGTRTLVKLGDTLGAVTRPLKLDDGPFPFTTADWRALASARLTDDISTTHYVDRDVTTDQDLHGNPLAGVFATPFFNGKGLDGAKIGAVAVAAGEVVRVIAPTPAVIGGPVIRQHLYMTDLTGIGTFFRVASGPLDFLIAPGLDIGDPNTAPPTGVEFVGFILSDPPASRTPAADAVLKDTAPTRDESLCIGEILQVDRTALTSAVAGASPGPLPGTLDVGSHDFFLINQRLGDSKTNADDEFQVDFENFLIERATGRRMKWPTQGFEQIKYTKGIS